MSLAKAIGPEVEELIREGSPDLAKAVADLHPADLAELLEDLPREDRLVLFEALPPEQGAAVLSELKGETLRLILHQASPEKLGPELDRLPGDEVVFLLEHLSQRQREVLLTKMSPRDADEAKRLLRYEPGTAGRLMTEKFAKVLETANCESAVPSMETAGTNRSSNNSANSRTPRRAGCCFARSPWRAARIT